MARSDDHDPGAAVPEADRLEQEQLANPVAADDQPWPTTPRDDVNEADRLEQAQLVVGDPDEEYTPDRLDEPSTSANRTVQVDR
jgi:hypothetical protein